MGEAGKDVARVGFDRAVKLAFHLATVSSDAGLFPYRDLDEAAGRTASCAADLFDRHSGSNIRHNLTALLRLIRSLQRSDHPQSGDRWSLPEVNVVLVDSSDRGTISAKPDGGQRSKAI